MDRRTFLRTAAAGGALAVAPAALAAPELDAKAVRTSASAVRLDWNAKAAPTAIFVSSDPDAQRPLMREVKAAAKGGTAAVPFAVAPRPYFLLATPDGRQTRVAERLLPLQGGRNFRDLGGYRSADGRQVRWGKLYRSGVMAGLTEADQKYLSDLDIEVVCDLRTRQERTTQPNPFLKTEAPQVIGVDYDMPAMSAFMQTKTRAEAVTAFANSYMDFIELLTPQYTDMFARLVRREAPLAFNCSAGKDRTGVAAALILSTLGVPRDTIIADYALTEVYSPPAQFLQQMGGGGQSPPGTTATQAQGLARLPREVMLVLMGADPEVMRQTLAMVDKKYGGPVELVKTRYGLTDAKIAYLRAAYLI